MNWEYIRKQTLRYTSGGYDRDHCLYKIGIHASVLNDVSITRMRGGELTPEMRSRILTWLNRHANIVGTTVSEYSRADGAAGAQKQSAC